MSTLSSIAAYAATTPRPTVTKTVTQSGATVTGTVSVSGNAGNTLEATATAKPTRSGASLSASVTVNGLYTVNAAATYDAANASVAGSVNGSRGGSAAFAADADDATLNVTGTTAQGIEFSVALAGNDGAAGGSITFGNRSRDVGGAI